ncbi:hypothetical protein FHS85_001749 [Rhodoligotrophos appendicifer]|uniref:hypothetical protein n=1 Tax=Rhodoligotrophos appendicifer TaxID=987056 RepID=UPI001185D465|nr:hypothetical protein [Rhodoligotrophos appendicifer]
MITHAEHHHWLLEIGMGWLGWTEQQTLNTTMSSIITAYRGRIDLLKTLLGQSSDKTQPQGRMKPATAANVLAVFRRLG